MFRSKLFVSGACQAEEVDYILLCTQSPDYFLPTTACLVQNRLGIPTTAGALDFNLGCSGYVYGLGLAEGLICSGQASRVLLLTAETYGKFLNPRDRSVRTIFGDAAAATLLTAVDSAAPVLGPFVYGSDGAGGPNLIVPAGGMRRPRSAATAEEKEDDQGNLRAPNNLFMNGPEIFNFTLSVVPTTIHRLLERSSLTLDQVDLFVFHQANRYMLDHLRKRLAIPPEKFMIAIQDCGKHRLLHNSYCAQEGCRDWPDHERFVGHAGRIRSRLLLGSRAVALRQKSVLIRGAAYLPGNYSETPATDR
ncbi:MAG TPA: ketoacyl-ACP synthase III [Bryobacteraceae bacterium]|nr:ketoacyl-ACP synthase III [Bryobacteraceae bacterium]